MFDFIARLIAEAGYLGVWFLMFLENVFPPIPSEIIMPLAGFTAARGDLNVVGVVLAGTAGTLCGALLWYWIGNRLGEERLKRWAGQHGRWLTLTPQDVDRIDAWFERHWQKAVFFGHLVPTIRTLVSIPAGIFGMGFGRFVLFTTLGAGVWNTALAAAGYLLEGSYKEIAGYLNPVTNVVIGVLVLSYFYRLVTWKSA